jgi:hypothetical protein
LYICVGEDAMSNIFGLIMMTVAVGAVIATYASGL